MHPFEQKIKETIERFNLIQPEDKLLVAASGGKDSTVLLHVLKQLGYQFEAITVDAKIGCYTEKNLQNIRKFCSGLGIKLHEISFQEEFGYSLCYLKAMLTSSGFNYTSCTVCGVLRRYLLNKYARDLGATKIATGHNMDDESQALLMNLLRGNLEMSARMGAEAGVVKDTRFVQRIKPLFFTPEQDIVAYSKEYTFPVQYGKCPCSVESYRYSLRQQMEHLEQQLPGFKHNMIQAFLQRLPALRAYYTKQQQEINACQSCNEPCRNDLCRACSLIAQFREKQRNAVQQIIEPAKKQEDAQATCAV